MAESPSHRRGAVAALVLVALLALATAGTAAAKEGVQVTLEAPIAMDSPPGAVLLVGLTAQAHDDATGQPVPVVGTPFALTLIGRDGATTRALAEGTRTPGYYTFHVEVPAGGPRGIEVGIRGSTQDGPVDLPVRIMGDPFTFGAIRPGTAQLADVAPAAPAAAASPATGAAELRVPAQPIVEAPADSAPAAAAPPAAAPPAAEGPPGWAIGGLAAALVAALAGATLLALARWRGARRATAGAERGG